MLRFRHKHDKSLPLVDTSGLDNVTIIAYRDLLVVVNSATPINSLLTQLRTIFGSTNGKLSDAIKFGLVGPNDVYYRIPLTDSYINKEFNRITLFSFNGSNIPVFLMPMIVDIDTYKITLEVRYDPEDTLKYSIGTHTLRQLYLISRHFIHIPRVLNTPDNKERIVDWYQRIRFVIKNDVMHPILVGDKVLFADYTTDNGDRIELGISPEYPTVLVKKCTPTESGESGKLVLSKYTWIYKYLEFSYTLPGDACLTGYIAFDNEITYNAMIHLPMGSFGRNLEGKDPIYMLATALKGGRTEERCCLSLDKLDKTTVAWVDADNIYGPDSVILDYKDEYMSKIKRS